MARPRNASPVAILGIRLPHPLYHELQRRAAAQDRPLSAVVRRALVRMLAEDENG